VPVSRPAISAGSAASRATGRPTGLAGARLDTYTSPVRTSSQRTKTLTLTEAAVLALLAMEGESSGYDLLRLARRSVANIWAPAKTQLYAILPRLVTAGLATQRAEVQERRPDKQLYRITAAGRTALQAWLDDPDDTGRDAFFLRLFVGGLTEPETLVAHVERFRERDEAELERLRAIVPTNTRQGHDAYHWYLLELGIEEYELRLRWADRVLESLRGLAA
jgi:DNA-binding PadR family transcriptional regulator